MGNHPIDGMLGTTMEKIKEMVDSNIKEFLDNNKEIIIKEAVNQLAERLSRTKAVKEALNKTIESIF